MKPRRWLFWVLAIAFVWLLVSRLAEIETLLQTLSRGIWQWIMVAALLQVSYNINRAGLYRSAFDIVGVRSRVTELLPVLFASLFVNVAAPFLGASGIALFMDDASRRGESPARAAVGALLVMVADLSSFTIVLAVGLAYLFVQHDLQNYQVFAALFLFAAIGGQTIILLLGLWNPALLQRLLGWVQRGVNGLGKRLRRPGILGDAWAEKTTAEFSEAAIAITIHPDRLLRTLAIGFLGHLINLASLYILFQAFRQPIGYGMLTAGYAMGILFWIVSITPQGIGVVEGVMTLVFSSLGTPTEPAAVVSLAFRGLTFWLPLAIGFVLLRRVKSFGNQERTRSEIISIQVVSVLTVVMGLVNLVSAVTPGSTNRVQWLDRFLPLLIRQGSHLAAAVAGFALLLLGSGLWRRKRVAWVLTVSALLVSAASHLFKGLDYEEAILASALAAWLFSLRPHFHARSDRPSVQQGLQTLWMALGFTLLYGILGFYLLDQHYQVHFGLRAAILQTVRMFLQYQDPGLQPITAFGRYFAASIYLVSFMTLSYTLFMLIRPVLRREPASPEEKVHARTIVQTYGCTPLARLTLLDDKSYFFSPGGSVIAYALKGRVALALGDPIGPERDFQPSLAAFQSFCASNDWQAAFYQVRPEHLALYHACGMKTVCIGNEGIVDLAAFSLAGGENKSLRTAVNKFTRLGFKTEVIQPPLPYELLPELRVISDEWLTHRASTEKRFSIGWFDESYLQDSPVILVRDSEGQAVAFANLAPEYQCNEISIDLMRYHPSAEKGVMDLLFVGLIEWAHQQGYTTFSLGLSALSGIGESSHDPGVERALHYVYEHVTEFYNFKGLHHFKDKYHPRWAPRYLVYPGPASLLAVTSAMVRLNGGEGAIESYLRRNRAGQPH